MSAKHSNLTLRVGSALLLFPFLVSVSWMGGLPFALLLAAAAAVSALELTCMLTAIGYPEIFGVAVAGLLPLAPWWAARYDASAYASHIPVFLAVAAMALLVLNLFRPGPIERAPHRVAASALAWLYCGVLISTVVGLRVHFGFGWVILAFVVSWLNDTLAYFGGRFFGKTPFFPKVSPKKTWEGFAGGALGSVLGALGTKAVFLALPQPSGEAFQLSWVGCVGVGVGASVLGPLGDLSESMLKRAAGVKDSGTLIPGHGGMLDRIDALLFITPWIYLWATLVQ
ncbi:MAG: phosphatidate cytidylyltransferase [Anaeromyxobacter sp. RBG_16_69_14]|nr:MAG: phosphatidate cytidylyltransferase [Anaeromyxobacter sp. RBG_16_69_14]